VLEDLSRCALLADELGMASIPANSPLLVAYEDVFAATVLSSIRAAAAALSVSPAESRPPLSFGRAGQWVSPSSMGIGALITHAKGKPFSYPELRARIAAVLRRTAARQPRPVLTAGPLRIDLRDRGVSVDERRVELSAVEYRLLSQMAGEPTRVLTKVNFEQGRRKARERGIQELGAGLVIPFHWEALAA
jgi:hypothetical protein